MDPEIFGLTMLVATPGLVMMIAFLHALTQSSGRHQSIVLLNISAF